MSDINVISFTQKIVVDPFSSSVAVINAGPVGPPGAQGVAAGPTSTNAQTGTSYTLQMSDVDKLVTMENSSASTITIPPNSSLAFPVGSTRIDIARLGLGSVTIVPGSGVTVRRTASLALRLQYSMATLIKIGIDTWLLAGDLA